MKLRIAVITAALLATASVAAQADYQFITDYYGYSWENGAHWQPGTEWKMDGILDDILPPMTADFGANEYTYYMSGNSQDGPAVPVGSGGIGTGAYVIYQINYTGGRLDVYEDPSKNHNWGVNPVNATSPATFIDGTLYLGATMSNTVFFITKYTATGYEIGSFEADLNFDSGSHLAEAIAGGTGGYTFAGLTKNNRSAIPTGYLERIDGQQFVTPVLPSTWGAIKSQYAK